jgi:hypothetical protein
MDGNRNPSSASNKHAIINESKLKEEIDDRKRKRVT